VIERILIVGTGLIGASIGLALRGFPGDGFLGAGAMSGWPDIGASVHEFETPTIGARCLRLAGTHAGRGDDTRGRG